MFKMYLKVNLETFVSWRILFEDDMKEKFELLNQILKQILSFKRESLFEMLLFSSVLVLPLDVTAHRDSCV